MRLIRGGEAVPDMPGSSAYDPNADMAAHSNSLKVRSSPPPHPNNNLTSFSPARTCGNRFIPQQITGGGTTEAAAGTIGSRAAQGVGAFGAQGDGREAGGAEQVVSVAGGLP
jgi:hypothetical protein